jgi:hypothetical protein
LERYLKALTVLMLVVGACAGCGRGPTEPDGPLALTSVVPREGASAGTTTARLYGAGFSLGMTVTVGSALVEKYTLVNPHAIDLTMPPHSPGVVDIVVTAGSDEVSRLAGVFTYVDYPPPAVTNMTPTRISTEGSALSITGTGFRSGASVTFDLARVSAFFYGDTLYTSAPPHPAGAVDVVVTNIDGQTVRVPGALTYAPPESFDFNGDWEGDADDGSHDGTVIRFTIRDNVMVSLSCGAGADLLPMPAPTVAGGRISSVGASITGRITSEGVATGSINLPPCGGRMWGASKKIAAPGL